MSELDLQALQDALSLVDLQARSRSRNPEGLMELLLLRKEQLKLKMYQERNHSRPHFHVDYGPQQHVATYAIDTGERLAGNLERKYDAAVTNWAQSCRPQLEALWQALLEGRPEQTFVQALPGMP